MTHREVGLNEEICAGLKSSTHWTESFSHPLNFSRHKQLLMGICRLHPLKIREITKIKYQQVHGLPWQHWPMENLAKLESPKLKSFFFLLIFPSCKESWSVMVWTVISLCNCTYWRGNWSCSKNLSQSLFLPTPLFLTSVAAEQIPEVPLIANVPPMRTLSSFC